MKHDEKKIDAIMSLADKRSIDDLSCGIDFVHCDEALREYAEHQDRWRHITERPEINSFVALIDPSDKTLHPLIAKWTFLKDSCADMGNYDGWQWKPVAMPEVAQ